jgi:glycosyltransferase involved in cell wall biosynthesis
MLKVVLDGFVDVKSEKKRLLFPKVQTLKAFASALSSQCQFLLITNSTIISAENTEPTEVIFIPTPANPVKGLLLKSRLTKQIKDWNADIIVHTGLFVPIVKTKKNILFLDHAKQLAIVGAKKLKLMDMFFTSSAFLKQQLIQQHQMNSGKIVVTPSPANSLYKAISWEQREELKILYSSHAEFFLYNHVPSKNDFLQLLKAFSLFKKRQQTNMKLLFPCSLSFADKELAGLLETYRYKEDIVFTGNTTAQQLAQLTATAYAVIQSALEPPLSQIQDVIQCVLPQLILQPQSWMKEEGCFEYANSLSAEEIAGKLMLLYKNEIHRKQLIENSQQLLQQFSLEATAKVFHTALLHAVTE